MTEEKKEAIAPEKTEAVTTPAQTAQPEKIQEMSKGEKWYNWILYTGVNYWLNLGISLAVTDYFLHGKGTGFFKNGVEKFSGSLRGAGMSKKRATWAAEQALGTFSLNSGGNILLVPTKFLEDDKRKWVYWFNEKLGVDQTAPDGHKETPDEIYIDQEQPKQSWPRMIGRRFIGWCATTATGMTLDNVLARKHPSPLTINGEVQTHKPGQQVFTETMQGGANFVLGNIGGKAIVNSPMAQRYMGYAALDWIYTLITSGILHATNGSSHMKAPHEIGDEKSPPAPVPIGDSLKPGEHLEPVAVPKGKHVSDILQKKDKEEGFAASVAKQSEAAGPAQLGA